MVSCSFFEYFFNLFTLICLPTANLSEYQTLSRANYSLESILVVKKTDRHGSVYALLGSVKNRWGTNLEESLVKNCVLISGSVEGVEQEFDR